MPNPRRIKGLFDAFDEALDMDASKEAVLRLGLKSDNTALQRANDPRMFPKEGYHGTDADFTSFKVTDGARNSHAHVSTTPDPKVANHFARIAGEYPTGSQVYPLKTKGNIFDVKNKQHMENLRSEVVKDALNTGGDLDSLFAKLEEMDKGNSYWKLTEHPRIQKAIRKLGFDGFSSSELGSNVKNIGMFNPANIRSKFARFNPKKAGIPLLTGGAGGAFMSSNLLAEPTSDLSRFAPKPQHEFRQAPSSLLDKAADAYQWTADEGGWLGEFLYGGGAKALRNLGNETTPMVKTGRLPAVPTGTALANLFEILQL